MQEIRNSGIRLRCVLLAACALGIAACGSGGTRPGGFDQPMTFEVQQLLEECTEALRNHAFLRAFELADSVESIQPGLADVPFMRARIHSELARLDIADSLYRVALDIRPDYPGAWHNLGNTAFRLQRYSDAIRYYRREIELHDDALPWRGIGRAYVELGKTDSAMAAFDRAIEEDPEFAEAHFSRSLLLDDLGDTEAALASVNDALAADPANPEYLYYAATYHVRLGRLEEALDPLLRVIDVWPWHQGAHYNVAQTLARLGRTEEAEAFQDRAERLRQLQAQISHHENTVRVQPTNAHAHAGLGTLLRMAGRYNDATHAYQVALVLEPGNLDYRNNLAVVYLLRDDTTEAIRMFEQIVDVDSTQLPAWINLGSLYAMSGNEAGARTAWEQALVLDPGNDLAESSLQRLE